MMTEKRYGGIEGGGTKFVCAVGNGPDHLIDEIRIPTTIPTEVTQKVYEFFASHLARLHGIGFGSFGPLDMESNSPTYGYITNTPKPQWGNTNILGMLREKINVPIVMDMDVAIGGLGEAKWGASRDDSHSLYLTIGTGIGAGYIMDGKPLRGLTSPEAGHIRIPHNLQLDPFRGACPSHGDCFEGLAAGPSIEARFSQRGETLPDNHFFWDIEAGYIAHALINYILTLSPKRIIIGGGVMQKSFMFPAVRKKVLELMNGYITHDLLSKNIDQYIVPPALGSRSGVLGAIALIMDAKK
jgi:fructokinase